MAKFIILISTLALIIIGALWLYAFKNNSGHTGLNPSWLYFYFIPLTLFGVLKIKTHRIALAPIIIGVLGIGSLVYIDKTNTLLEYNIWVERGMPTKSED